MITSERTELSVSAIERGDIDVEAFDHEAHVYAGWRFVREMPLLEAIERFSSALKRLTHNLGVPEKYHGTVTWFYMLLIAERQRPDQEWAEFRNANADLFERDLLARYYTPEVLSSAAARKGFVLPDRIAA